MSDILQTHDQDDASELDKECRELQGEIIDLKQRLHGVQQLAANLQRTLSYVTYQRMPLGDQVFDHLEEHWKLRITQVLSHCEGMNLPNMPFMPWAPVLDVFAQIEEMAKREWACQLNKVPAGPWNCAAWKKNRFMYETSDSPLVAIAKVYDLVMNAEAENNQK